MRVVLLSMLVLLATTLRIDAASPLDKIKRAIAKEPAYNAKEPLYALAAFGTEAKTTVWFVADKSKADSARYDLLYADLNGNGDLTEKGERIVAAMEEVEGGDTSQFKLPDYKDAAGGVHTEFSVSIHGGTDDGFQRHAISLKWRGERNLGGGYPTDPDKGYMRFAKSAAEAPIVWFNGDGPVQFQRWLNPGLSIGGQDDVSLFLGFEGVGPSSFCAYQQYVLPEGEGVRAVLRYNDKEGNKRIAISEITGRC